MVTFVRTLELPNPMILKKVFLLLIISLLTAKLGTIQAQDSLLQETDSLSNDSVNTTLIIDVTPKDGFNFWEERFKGNWAGVFIAVNGFAQPDYSMYAEMDDGFMEPEIWRSNCLSINLIQASLGLQRNRNFIGLVTGLGADFQSYRLDKNYSLEKGTDRVEPVQLAYEDNLKSKFSSIYLSAPVLLEFQIPMGQYSNRMYFSAGVITSVRLETHTKVKYRVDNKRQKLKEPGDFYLRDIRFAGTVRLGYRWINLFATYDLQPLFKDGKGPELYPFSVGVALITF
ncbi:outer membrane protein with beta-barrel domain [Mangrovibacterium diazotrophicum]|uniref:Outer membrane protein with beta-barrel domain n=2 Tax=Mangrovibacterium diazotrophicum TaxID=1261403 RepID=A0A419W9T8_9BACT|nr:outer membrane protein with beta-barrel domain [Mangrovibacterium diazotrophicum]